LTNNFSSQVIITTDANSLIQMNLSQLTYYHFIHHIQG